MSNTSTHAPIYSFGTEKRDYQKEAEIMARRRARDGRRRARGGRRARRRRRDAAEAGVLRKVWRVRVYS